MKDIFESSESFTAHATISAGYYLIEEAQKEFDKKSPKNTLEKMIDDSTGYAEVMLREHILYLLVCLEDIIDAKKVIEADYSKDQEFKDKLLKILPNNGN